MIDQATLKELLHYDPDTGVFTWIKTTSNRVKIGDRVGNVMKAGYIEARILGKRTYLHRLAHLYMTGKWPEGDVDHINGDRADNRWHNLRDVSRRTNLQNRRSSHSRSSVGLLGVACNGDRYRAQIKLPTGKTKYIGLYDTPEEAHEAYLMAKRKHHEGCTI
jgi:hypothetical protein